MTAMPPTSGAPSPTAPANGSNCCLRGCLVTAVALLAVAILGSVSLCVFGRPWLARELPGWKAKRPLLALAVEALGVEKYLAGAGARPVDLNPRQPGVAGRDAVPGDVALFSDAATEAVNVGEDEVSVYQELSLTPAEAEAYLAERMAGFGWQAETQGGDDSWRALSWRKDDRVCVAEVVARGQGAELWLHCTHTAPKPAE